jgi:hypothetical protein
MGRSTDLNPGQQSIVATSSWRGTIEQLWNECCGSGFSEELQRRVFLKDVRVATLAFVTVPRAPRSSKSESKPHKNHMVAGVPLVLTSAKVPAAR